MSWIIQLGDRTVEEKLELLTAPKRELKACGPVARRSLNVSHCIGSE
jgi:hypothetical protein